MAVDAGGGFKVIAELFFHAGQLPDLIFSQSFPLCSMLLFALLLLQWEVLSQLTDAFHVNGTIISKAFLLINTKSSSDPFHGDLNCQDN